MDIVQNSISAHAALIEVSVTVDRGADTLTVSIKDDGSGMSKEMLANVADPNNTFNIGKRNVLAAKKILWQFGLGTVAEDVDEVAPGVDYETDGGAVGAGDQAVAGLQGYADLAVGRQVDVLIVAVHHHFHRTGGGQDQGAAGEGEGTDGGEDDGRNGRIDHRPPRRKVIGRGTGGGGGGDDDAVGPEVPLAEIFDHEVEGYNARQGPLVDHRLIEGQGAGHGSAAPFHGHFQGQPFFHQVVSGQDIFQ